MSTQHSIVAIRSGHTDGMDWEAEYRIQFNYVRGADPIIHPADNADPGWPAEVEFVSVKPVIGVVDAGAFTDLAQRELDQWAEDWLDENYVDAVEKAEDDMQPDPDAAYDAMRDERDL